MQREHDLPFMQMQTTAVILMMSALSLFNAAPLLSQDSDSANDYRALLKEGDQALAQNRLPDAARAFQRAVDLNPSSVKAHQGLGVALLRAISAANFRPSADNDMAERAETHLSQAAELSPSAAGPLLELSGLEALLAERASDADEKTARYQKARDRLKQAITLEPSKPELYLRLANLERDEFGPTIQKAIARFAKSAGPIPDSNLRQSLQQQYAALVDDAIGNAQRASEMNGGSQRPLLLLSRLFRERAAIRDTQEQFVADMHSASDYQRQFQAVGGHVNNQPGVPQ